jgi:hypothetical protein
VEKIKHILCSITCDPKIMLIVRHLQNMVVRQASSGSVIWHMCFAFWITKAADTLRTYNTSCFSVATVILQCALMFRLYMYCPSCYL